MTEKNQPFYKVAEPELPREHFPINSWQREMYDRGQRFYGYPLNQAALEAIAVRIDASRERQRKLESAKLGGAVIELASGPILGPVDQIEAA